MGKEERKASVRLVKTNTPTQTDQDRHAQHSRQKFVSYDMALN